MKTIAAVLLAFSFAAMPACTTNGSTNGAGDGGSALKLKLERADLAMREARLVDAEILYRDLAVSHPRLPEIWLQLGNIYARQSQLDAAMHSYKEGLRFSPDDGRLWHNLALIELRQSIRTLEIASELLPTTNPHLARIQDLHRALLLTGQSPAGTE